MTCQSANQLKTPAKVSWAFKMVSQFGSWGYTIMGKTADLTVVQKTIIDTLHKEGKPHTFIAKEAGCSQSAVSKHVNRKLSGRKKCGRKRCTTNRENRGCMRTVKQNRFKWTSQGMDWGWGQGIPIITIKSITFYIVVWARFYCFFSREHTYYCTDWLLSASTQCQQYIEERKQQP